MIRKAIRNSNTYIDVNDSFLGETIEMKMERVINSGEPIKEGASMIYTDRKDGVRPEYDIRTDRFDIALEAMDKVTKSQLAKRDEFYKKDESKPDIKKDESKPDIEVKIE